MPEEIHRMDQESDGLDDYIPRLGQIAQALPAIRNRNFKYAMDVLKKPKDVAPDLATQTWTDDPEKLQQGKKLVLQIVAAANDYLADSKESLEKVLNYHTVIADLLRIVHIDFSSYEHLEVKDRDALGRFKNIGDMISRRREGPLPIFYGVSTVMHVVKPQKLEESLSDDAAQIPRISFDDAKKKYVRLHQAIPLIRAKDWKNLYAFGIEIEPFVSWPSVWKVLAQDRSHETAFQEMEKTIHDEISGLVSYGYTVLTRNRERAENLQEAYALSKVIVNLLLAIGDVSHASIDEDSSQMQEFLSWCDVVGEETEKDRITNSATLLDKAEVTVTSTSFVPAIGNAGSNITLLQGEGSAKTLTEIERYDALRTRSRLLYVSFQNGDDKQRISKWEGADVAKLTILREVGDMITSGLYKVALTKLLKIEDLSSYPSLVGLRDQISQMPEMDEI